MAENRVYVEPPPVVAWRYGLMSAAMVLTADGRWQIGGTQWQGDACGQAQVWVDSRCDPGQQASYMVSVELAAAPVEDGDQVTATATALNSPVRALTVTVNGQPPVVVNTGAAAVPVAMLDVPATGLTVDVTADTAGAVTAQATVDAGSARDVTVQVQGNTAVTLTTGAGPQPVGNVAPDGSTYTVDVTDDPTGTTGQGQLTVTTQAGGTAQVQLTVGRDRLVDVTVVDEATGTSEAGDLYIDHTGSGSARLVFRVREMALKPPPDGMPVTVSGGPFTVVAGVRCKALGVTDAEQRALDRLRLLEQRAVERQYWDTLLATDQAFDITPEPGTGVDLVTAVGLLEEALSGGYAGTGTIHAPRQVAAHADRFGLVHPSPGVLRTILDTQWAFGSGYDGTGPGGSFPADGQVWMYATGQVVVRRGQPFIPAGARDGGFDPATNTVTVRAERVYVLGHDCFAAAVLVNLNQPAPASRRITRAR